MSALLPAGSWFFRSDPRATYCMARGSDKRAPASASAARHRNRAMRGPRGRVRSEAVAPTGSNRRARVGEQAIVGERDHRREVAVVLVIRALEGGLLIRDGVEDQREDAAVPGRHVGGRAVDHEIAEDEAGAGRAVGGEDATLVGEAGDGIVGHGPERIAGGDGVEARGGGTVAVGATDEPERAVEFGDVVEEEVQVERQRPANSVLAVVGGEIVMPLPEVAAEGR